MFYAYDVAYHPADGRYIVGYVDWDDPGPHNPEYRQLPEWYDTYEDARGAADRLNADAGIVIDQTRYPLARSDPRAQYEEQRDIVAHAIMRAILGQDAPAPSASAPAPPDASDTHPRNAVPTDGAHPITRPDLPPHLARERTRGAGAREELRLSSRILAELASLNLDPSA